MQGKRLFMSINSGSCIRYPIPFSPFRDNIASIYDRRWYIRFVGFWTPCAVRGVSSHRAIIERKFEYRSIALKEITPSEFRVTARISSHSAFGLNWIPPLHGCSMKGPIEDQSDSSIGTRDS